MDYLTSDEFIIWLEFNEVWVWILFFIVSFAVWGVVQNWKEWKKQQQLREKQDETKETQKDNVLEKGFSILFLMYFAAVVIGCIVFWFILPLIKSLP